MLVYKQNLLNLCHCDILADLDLIVDDVLTIHL